jgi:CheY-like chemotaxis protein
VAHDFNNILTAIVGYGQVALMKMAKDDPLRFNIERMLEGADRAAHLTQSLLAFGRKQVMDRKPVDMNEIIKKVERFLLRIIGEDIEFKTLFDEGTVNILADSGQIEQVLMNFATNARDAMPNGGTFTIAVGKTKIDEEFIRVHGFGQPGIFAMITASDTGNGMDDETRRKIFEPFFTTKELGKGTGLGLAVVYGIIKQHNGYINVYSEPRKGTTFRIYLPVIAAGVTEEKQTTESELLRSGTETILLAEDDESVRLLERTLLDEFGYKVIVAIDGEDAVKKFTENKEKIQLLLFDLIMPKKSGKEAYDEIKKIRPDIKTIFLSGYSPDVIREKVMLEKEARLVFKPISPVVLLRTVRETLDQ